MASVDQMKMYYVLAVVFGVLAIGVFLYPGVPSTLLGWLIKAIMLIAFGVYLWIVLQDLQVTTLTGNRTDSRQGVKHTQGAAEETTEEKTQLELEFSTTTDAEDLPQDLDPARAYRTFQERLLEIIQETLVSHSVMVYIADPGSGTIKLQDGRHPGEVTLKRSLPLNQELIGKVLRKGEPVLLGPDERAEETVGYDYYQTPVPSIQSFLAVPLEYRGNTMGVLAVDDVAKGSYSEDDLELMNEFAQVISSAMVQFDVIDQLKDQRDFYSQLCRLNSEINLTDSAEDLYSHIVRVGKELFHYDMMAMILLQEEESRQAEVAVIDGASDSVNPGYRFELEESILTDVIETGEPFSERDLREANLPKEISIDPALPLDKIQSAVIAPIRDNNITYGAMVLGHSDSRDFIGKDQRVLMILGAVIGAALNKLFHYRYMKNIATRDGLTNIYNYRAFMERLQEEVERGERYQTPFTLLFSDLDKFKRINDEHGHQYGDQVLCEVAKLISNSVRSVDIVARYGGEEFVVIVLNTTIDDAFKTANRIRETIKNHSFEINGVRERITMSIGMAGYPEHADDSETLLARADEAMYRVKQVGGNAVKGYKKDQKVKEE